jgi:energy-converting hydrogenase Eha subunit A
MRGYKIALPTKVQPVTGSYTFGEESAVASIQAGWVSGSTITLPGPSSGHNPPNNGDTYAIADPQNVLALGTETLIINGGGYEFLADVGGVIGLHASATFGSLLFGVVGEGNAALKAGLVFVFDATAGIWIVL